MKKKLYSAYKPSGVEWLGDVPEHWEVKKVGHTTFVKGRIGWQGLTSDEFIDEGPFCVTGTDFIDGKIDWNTCYHVSEERYLEDPYIHLRENDLLITKDGTIGKTAVVSCLQGKATLNSGIFITRPIRVSYSAEFMFWTLNSRVFSDFIELEKTGTTISHLYQNVFVRFHFPLPPLPEQQAITTFLDAETGKIDSLVTKNQRLVELLKEKRMALISRTVTKGLNLKAPMKPSGVEWLGDVPEHWEVKKLKFAFWLSRGVDLPSESFIEGQFPVYGSNGIIGYHDKYTTKGPCVVVGRSGSVGEVNYVEGPFWAHNTALYIQEFHGIITRFSYYLLLVIDLKSLSAGSAVGTLNRNYIHDILIALPSIPEQQVIAGFLDAATGKIDSLVTKVETAVEKLKEYRTALISAVVTGKIDVREAV